MLSVGTKVAVEFIPSGREWRAVRGPGDTLRGYTAKPLSGQQLKRYPMGGRYIVIGPDGRQTVVNAGSEREAKMKVILSQAHIQPLNRKERRSFIAQARGYKAIKI